MHQLSNNYNNIFYFGFGLTQFSYWELEWESEIAKAKTQKKISEGGREGGAGDVNSQATVVVVLSELSGHRKQKKRNDFAIDCFMIEGGSGERERKGLYFIQQFQRLFDNKKGRPTSQALLVAAAAYYG